MRRPLSTNSRHAQDEYSAPSRNADLKLFGEFRCACVGQGVRTARVRKVADNRAGEARWVRP